MKRDCFNSFEERDLRICSDMEFEANYPGIFVRLTPCFDVDRKFGTYTYRGKNIWIDVSAVYNPVTSDIRMFYNVNDVNGSQGREYIMTDEERDTVAQYIEKMCIENHEMTCTEFYITQYAKHYWGNINLECRQEGDAYIVYNVNDGAVLYQEDLSGDLYEHIGHKIELANYGDGECYSIECVDCEEVIYSSDIERIELRDIEDNDGMEMHM